MFVYPLPPDWQHGLDLNLQYKTDIIRAWDGQEQRNSARANPRVTIAFTDWRNADEAREMRRYFHNRLQKTTDANDAATEDFLMPLWTEPQVVIGQSADQIGFREFCRYVGDDTIYYVTNGISSGLMRVTNHLPEFDFLFNCVYTYVVLDEFPVPAEYVDINTAAYFNDHIVGWLAIPCLPVRFTPSVTRKVITADITESKMTFPVSPGKFTMPAIPPAPDRPNHLLARELFDFPINIKNPVSVDMMDNSVRRDDGRTDPDVFHNVNFISEVYKIGMTFYSKPDIEAFVDFYRRHEGMKRSFYWPSNEYDFIPAVNQWTGNGIRVKGQEAVDIFYHRDVRDENGEVIAFEDITTERIEPNPIVGIAIWYKGEWITNIVDTVQTTGDDSYLVCRHQFPEFDPTHPLTDRTRISILHQARFATDEMTTRYLTNQCAEISTGIQTIPDEGERRNDESE